MTDGTSTSRTPETALSTSRRLNDRHRAEAARRLEEAVADGRLSLHEYDHRLKAVYEARVRADLQPLVADLEPDQEQTEYRLPRALVMLWVVWASVVALNVAVWGMWTTAVGGGIHPWPVWVAIPPGVALLGATAVHRAARRRN
ncbi:DUF1707 SHOCT-like domain-containing protein [Actinoplanes sp. CA-131856]